MPAPPAERSCSLFTTENLVSPAGRVQRPPRAVDLSSLGGDGALIPSIRDQLVNLKLCKITECI